MPVITCSFSTDKNGIERASQTPDLTMRIPAHFVLLLALVASCRATTLQKLGLDDMIQQSTGIVRAKVSGSYAALRGSDIYTYYRLDVLESFKGTIQREIAVPGGAAGGRRQVVAGAPELTTGQEYVLFYWTSKSGLTQLIGLSQGLFSERAGVPGNPLLVRPASTEAMLGRDGKAIQDQPASLRLSDMRARVRETLAQNALAQGTSKQGTDK
jgi:hypothetical protein